MVNGDLGIIILSVSTLSLVVSALSFYLTHLRSGVIIVLPPKEALVSPSHVCFPLVLINKGAKLGTIEDLILKLKDEDTERCYSWEPRLDSVGASISYVEYPPVPVTISGRSSVSKTFGFKLRSPSSKIEEGTYSVSIQIKTKKKWSELIQFKMKVDLLFEVKDDGKHYLIIDRESITPVATHKVKF